MTPPKTSHRIIRKTKRFHPTEKFSCLLYIKFLIEQLSSIFHRKIPKPSRKIEEEKMLSVGVGDETSFRSGILHVKS